MAILRWDRLDEDEFNRAVESLLVRALTSDGLVAQAVDGRGGDGGIDVDVRVKTTGQLVRIYQLKYFPGGFSGGFRKRREQIRKSFEAAMTHSPPTWFLVFPGNPTIQERKYVSTLASGRGVQARILGIAELDGLLAEHPSLDAYLARDRTIDALRAVNRPQAQLTRPDDLQSELRRIQNQLDARSAYWTMAFSVGPDGSQREELIAKRPDAAEREPLSVTLTAAFGPNNRELREAFEDQIGYGGSRKVRLPRDVVVSLEREGPDWFAKDLTGAEVELIPLSGQGTRSVEVRARSSEGKIAKLVGTTQVIDRGFLGGSVETVLEGGLEIRWRFSATAGEGGNLSLDLLPTESTPREYRRAFAFCDLLTKDAELELRLEGLKPLKMYLSESGDFAQDVALAEFIDDLVKLEDHFDLAFRFNIDDVTRSDRIWARVLNRIIRGEPTPMPNLNAFTGTLNGSVSDQLTELLTTGGAMLVTQELGTFELLGRTLEIGPLRIYSHHALVDDGADLLRLVNEGRGAGATVSARPVDGLPFLVYSPQAVESAGSHTVIPHPWNLTGIDEHPGFGALPLPRHATEHEL